MFCERFIDLKYRDTRPPRRTNQASSAAKIMKSLYTTRHALAASAACSCARIAHAVMRIRRNRERWNPIAFFRSSLSPVQ